MLISRDCQEPTTMALGGLDLAALMLVRRKKA